MPTSQQHKEKATHNHSFLRASCHKTFPDWATVVAFYAAVHLVERLRTKMNAEEDQHSKDHFDRLRFVQKHHREIHTAYRELYNASLLARYHDNQTFLRQFTSSDVEKTLIEDFLDKISDYVSTEFMDKKISGLKIKSE